MADPVILQTAGANLLFGHFTPTEGRYVFSRAPTQKKKTTTDELLRSRICECDSAIHIDVVWYDSSDKNSILWIVLE